MARSGTRRGLAAAAVFVLAAVAGVVGNRLTDRLDAALAVFVVLITIGVGCVFHIEGTSSPPIVDLPAQSEREPRLQVGGLASSAVTQGGKGNMQVINSTIMVAPGQLDSRPRTSRRAPIAVAIGAVLLLGGVVLYYVITGDSSAGVLSQTAVHTDPVPADPSAPPLIVESVSPAESSRGDGTTALPQPLTMSAKELETFNSQVVVNSARFASWSTAHQGAAVDDGLVRIVFRGNMKEIVRIADVQVLKDCRAPFSGTLLQGHTEGGGSPERLAFDLDSPNPIPLAMVGSLAQARRLGVNYFAAREVRLGLGETLTMSISVSTRRYACAFRFRVIVATSHGEFFQDVDDHGAPFKISAMATPVNELHPFSGYRTTYAFVCSRSGELMNWKWQRVDPRGPIDNFYRC